MPLIERNHLLQRFIKLLAEATKVDIAVAWATPCDALEALAEAASKGATIRIAVGVSRTATDPKALRRLQGFADLRIAPSLPPPEIFHPKYFSFHGPRGTICWIGSANLTRGGFGVNYELVYEFNDNDSTGEGRRWFESLWEELDPDPGPAIDEYERGYRRLQRGPRPAPQGGIPDREPLAEQSTWDDFVAQLRVLDDYWYEHSDDERWATKWDVLGKTHSWLHTIATGREVVRLPDWRNLTKRECYILRGEGEGEGEWGLLGGLRGEFRRVFNPERMPGVGPVRTQLHGCVNRVLNADDDQIAEVAWDMMQEIWGFRGFGAAVATRLLTLARPDRLVSVNGRSARRLGMLAGLPRNPHGLAIRYVELLTWVYDQPWFNAPQPDDPFEQTIWNSRAALLDAFVYEGG